MSYAIEPSAGLRFGDIVRGFVSATPALKQPFSSVDASSFDLHVTRPDFMAVLSPCCSIADKLLLLAPLIGVRPKFFENPYFAEHLTRINHKIDPEQSLPPVAWNSLSDIERATRHAKGKSYAFLELFVYEQHE